MKNNPLNIVMIIGLFIIGNAFTLKAIVPSGASSSSDYEKQWKQVETLEKQGKPQSAIIVVNEIYGLAKTDKNEPQMLKALEYGVRLTTRFEENYLQKAITKIKAEIRHFKAPSTQILHALMADLYLGHYNANRHIILSRTAVRDFKLEDMAVWDQKHYAEAIFNEFNKSLQDPELLQSTPTSVYADILDKSDSLNIFRPTLYDILAHNALDFYKNDEFMISRPAVHFKIDDPQMLDIAEVFVKLALEEKEAFSMKLHALELYQDLIAFHLNDENPAALVDLDLDRLDFVAQNGHIDDGKKVLLHTLEQMESLYIGKEAVTEVYYHLALIYKGLGQQYRPLKSDEHKRDLVIAAQYCENAIKEFPKSYGAKLCENLLTLIYDKALSSIVEYANIPGKPILSSLGFRNVSTVYVRIIPLDADEELEQRRNIDEDQKLIKYRQIRPVKHWSIELPAEIDHNLHHTEFPIPPLTEGYYSLMVSDNPAFEKKKGVCYISNFWVTNLSYVSNEDKNGDKIFYMLDRQTGTPVPDVKATVYHEVYDRESRDYKVVESGSYHSNDGGIINIPVKKKRQMRVILDLVKDEDRLISKNYFYLSKKENYVSSAAVTHFFTDRSVYRPGQTVYFKGIMLERMGEKYEIRKNTPSTIKFYDANNQLISELELQSNEYGSVNGSFTAPIGQLTGRMRIQDDNSYAFISVEEYKRPRFEVVLDPVKGSYKLDSEVTVTGKAMAYTGTPVDHAKVKYRIVRNTFYPYKYYFREHYRHSQEMEISSGEIETDVNGAFSIDFTAISDHSSWHMFNYTVYVDLTDISGETHSAQKSVAVGDKSLLINLDIPDQLNADDKNTFKLETTNLNGEAEPALVDVRITELKTPGRMLAKRNWNVLPDIYLMTKDAFRESFPDHVYKDEDDPSKWEINKTRFDKSLDTKNQSKLTLDDLSKWSPGKYKIEMTAEDVFGEEVSVTKYFTLYAPSSNKLPMKMANWFVPLKAIAEPGEKASFLVGTSHKNVKLLYEISGKDGVRKREWITLNDEQHLLEIPVKGADRGGLGVSLVFVHANRSYSNTLNIEVPYTNKKLDISFETFRDKLAPGQQESWNIKIRSYKGEQVAAEMLAGMYDASLDAIKPHHWNFSLFNFRYTQKKWDVRDAFENGVGMHYKLYKPYKNPPQRTYNQFLWNGIYFHGSIYPGYMRDGMVMSADGESKNIRGVAAKEEEFGIDEFVEDEISILPPPPEESKSQEAGEIPIRKNLQETAFFFPDLKTNADGDIIVSFTMPESLTRWKFMGLAHTQDLKNGQITKELLTQKDLMVIPNQPRFFREGDEIWFSAKVVNMSDKELDGKATLQILDAISMQPLNEEFGNHDNTVDFTASEGNSALVSWKLNIPEGAGPVMYRITAKSGNFSDGEEMLIPVLKNRMLVTESMPLPINGNESKDFVFKKLAGIEAGSSTLRSHSYTLEFTSNPAWYAVQALPYLMEYPYECSEQVFNRVYANGFATHIVNQHPKIKNVFESWKSETPDALLSNLEKNQDLKNALLEETPWVMQAKNESERKKRIALLFDLNRMDNELNAALKLLKQKQLSNGGWPWFDGGRDNRFITQYILTGFGKMQHLGVLDKDNTMVMHMIRKAIRYADERMFVSFTDIKSKHDDYQSKNYLDRTHIQYLYARSFFMEDYYLLEKHKEGYSYFKEQAKKYWLEYDKSLQAMIALSVHRLGETTAASAIMASIKEHALYDDEMGMYWRQHAGYYWYEAPIETQALLIEAFDEISDDMASVELMKTWLLKQKQTHDWETTKATADACYALLARGANLLAEEGDVSIQIGGEDIIPEALEGVRPEAGTGYFQHQWSGSEINPDMANISITKANDGVAWGAVYWQYFEDLDKITPHASPLSIQKKLFVEINTTEGPVLEPVNDGDMLKPGDKVISRIEIRVDRDMEFVHMKDMRAAALEPRNQLSGYRWQGGMGYYESIRDASVNFFFSYLRKGTWVFEYPLNVTQKGSFSNGISTIQCMYAPEFAAHSEGVRILVH
ncbi:MAG: alpha-2-macroglobulin family protein [Bacteroidota bacterium]